ncbi:hypothetical protein [Embleya sp. NPDC059237]|uniref:hypothetical protein n=1 Tax=Embleya sp. NPDC059237 TaxID=3346784 RepID=UPI0036759936
MDLYTAQDIARALDRLIECEPEAASVRRGQGFRPPHMERGRPSSLAARILFALGATPLELLEVDGNGARRGKWAPPGLARSRTPLRRRYTAAAWRCLDAIQVGQDNGRSWFEVRSIVRAGGSWAHELPGPEAIDTDPGADDQMSPPWTTQVRSRRERVGRRSER